MQHRLSSSIILFEILIFVFLELLSSPLSLSSTIVLLPYC
nr:MAG TPA: hypothetical protein [Caudoviricetes sp.]